MATTPLLFSMLYVLLPVLGFATASRQFHDYFDDDNCNLESIQGTENPTTAVKVLEADIALAVFTFTSFFLGPSLSH